MRTSATVLTPRAGRADRRLTSLGEARARRKTGLSGRSGPPRCRSPGSPRAVALRAPRNRESQMNVRAMVRPGLAAVAVTAAVLAVPASAKVTPSNVGSASVYGLDKNFTLVGHTDLAQRGMNSPIAVAGKCVYVGDRYYSGVSGTPD